MKNYFLLFASVLTVALLFSSCREEPFVPDTFGSVFGQVLVEGNNLAVEGASVSTNPPTNILTTDNLGRFALEDVKSGNYTLRIEKTGYVTRVENLSIIADKSVNVVIKLIPDSLANNAPTIPAQPVPADGFSELETTVLLSWFSEDIDDDVLTYDIKLFNADQTEFSTIAEGLTTNSFELTGLDFGSSYFWQVIVNDGQSTVNGDLWNFKTASFPDHRFLFARSANGKYDIYSSDELGNTIQLTDNGANNWRPRMNPERTKIAFLSSQSLETHIYIMNRDGSDGEKVSSLPVIGDNIFDLDFTWSPDGEKLLYMNGDKLYTVNRDGTGTNLFAEAPNGFTFAECDWTVVNDRIMARVVGDDLYESAIYLYESDGSFVQTVQADTPGSTNGPVFSITGTGVLYTHDVSNFEVADGRQLDARIFMREFTSPFAIDVSTEKTPGTNDLDARYSPDGAWIIFVNTNNDGISQKDIYRMGLDGMDRELLFENAEMPDWR